MSDLPAPLVPPDVDLRDFAFMPLDVRRLRDSDLVSYESPEACFAAVLLWSSSWHQVPAGSIPNNDQWIAKQAGYAARGRIDPAWNDVREGAMRGWILCSDDRLYHPVVAEKAIDAWETRTGFRETSSAKAERQKRWRERCKDLSEQLRARGVTPPAGASLQTLEALLRDAGVDVDGDERVDAQSVSSVDAETHKETSTVDEGEIGCKGEQGNSSAASPGFAEFWDAWPKKVDKVDALKAWKKLGHVNGLLPTILAAVRTQAVDNEWHRERGKYCPSPAKWIRGRRWEDEGLIGLAAAPSTPAWAS